MFMVGYWFYIQKNILKRYLRMINENTILKAKQEENVDYLDYWSGII